MLNDYVAGTWLSELSKGFGDVVLRAQAIATRTHALHARAQPRSPSKAALCHQRMRIEPLSSLTARVAGTPVLAASGSVLGASL